MPDSVNLFGSIGGGSAVRSDDKGKITVKSSVFDEMSQALYDVRDKKIQIIDDKISNLTKKNSALSEIEEKLRSIRSISKSLTGRSSSMVTGVFSKMTANGFGTRTDSSSPSNLSDVIEGNITSSAKLDSFKLEVIQKAVNHSVNSSGSLSDETSACGTAFTLQLKTTGSYQDIEILSTYTLTDIQNKINSVSDETGVKAFITKLNDTAQLTFQSKETGIVLFSKNENGEALPDYIPSQTNENLTASIEDGTNNVKLLAQYKFNNITATSKTNSIEPTPGVTLTLKKDEPGTVYDVSISPDKEKILEKLALFEKSYNDLNELAKKHSEVDSDFKPVEGAELYNTKILDVVKNELANILLGVKNNLNNTDFSNLEQIGMTRDLTSGDIKFDLDKMSTLIDSDFDKVKRLFDFNSISSNNNIGIADKPISISSTILHHEGELVETQISITKTSSKYIAEITFDKGLHFGKTYIIETDIPSSGNFAYFDGSKAKLNGEVSDLLNGFNYFIKDEDATFPMTSTITMNDGLMSNFSSRIDKMFDVANGDFKECRDELIIDETKYKEEKVSLEEKYIKRIERLERKLAKVQGTLSRLEGLLSYVDAFANAGNK